MKTPPWIFPVRRSLRLTASGTFLALGLAHRSSPTEPGHAAILKSVVPTTLSLGGYWHTVIILRHSKLTCTSFKCCSVALLSPSRATQMYASAELKALNASSVKLGSRKTALRRRWFMTLSTSEFVTDTSPDSSAKGQSGFTPVSAPIFKTGSGTWLLGV